MPLTREEIEGILERIIKENAEMKGTDGEQRIKTSLQRNILEACRLWLISDRQRDIEEKIRNIEDWINQVKMAV